MISVIKELHSRTNVKIHKTVKSTHQTASISPRHDAYHSDNTILYQNINEVKDTKDIGKSFENIGDDKVVESKTSSSDSELNRSFESLPTQVVSIQSDHKERMSPLDEFNSLHRFTEGVRRSIRMKESSIV